MTTRDAYDTLAPEFAVTVNGQPLPSAALADLIGLSLLDDVDAPGMFTLTLAAWDTAQMQAKWIDEPLFTEGNPVEISFGYRDRIQPLFAGEITGIEAEFPEGRPPTVTVRGYDRRHRLMRTRKTRSFTNCRDSDIASQIASEANLRPQTEDSTVTLPHVLQHNQTDLEFLQLRARRIGFELSVRDRDLYFRPRKIDQSAEITLRREVDLLEFYPRLTTLGQVPRLEVRGWNPARKEAIVASAGPGDETKVMGGTRSGPDATKRAFDSGTSARVASPVASQDEADAMARRGFAEMALGFVAAEATCIGEPRLRAGIVVEVEGIGQRFGGPYYLTQVEHAFVPRRGYRTRFIAQRNAI
jgi:phage protein D